MQKASKEKPSSGSFDLWEQLKQMPIAMTAAQLLELVPRFRDRLVKDISAESTKERTSKRNDKRQPKQEVQINSAEVLPAMIYDEQVPVVTVEIAN